MPPKRFEGKFGIPPSHPVDSLLTQALYRLPESMSLEHIERLTNDIAIKVNRAREQEGVGQPLTPEEIQTLHLKLARYYEDNGESAKINISTCVDALVESPRFLNSDRGSMEKLFELHEMKTLQKIAEIRRKRAEITGREKEESLNPYENLFETTSGKYSLARLLNMPHLEEESEYMNHCVGTSNSYINKMKRSEVEIFSLRHVPVVDPAAQRLEEDTSVMTIEYNCKTKIIEQVKGQHDEYLNKSDSYFNDVIDALKQLRTTRTDTGELRDFARISPSEMENIRVRENHILTSSGEVHFRDFDPKSDSFILKMGKLEVSSETPKEDAVKILRIVDGSEFVPDEIAYNPAEISERTKAYIGPLEHGIFDALPRSVEQVYTKFPESRVNFRNIELGTGIQDGPAFQKAIEGKGMKVSRWAGDMLKSPDFKVADERVDVDLVEVPVSGLGFNKNTRYDAICTRAQEFGLELCPAEVGPQLRLQYTDQPSGEYLQIAMKTISGSGGYPNVFRVSRDDDVLWLFGDGGGAVSEWGPDGRFVFFRPRK